MGRLQGKVAIITGAASGMGATTAKLFAKEGAKVVATDIQTDALDKLAQEIEKDNGAVLSLKLDVTSEKDWQNVIAKTNETYEKIDVLVNNAGVATDKTIANMEMDEWNKISDVLLNGCVIGMKYVIPEM